MLSIAWPDYVLQVLSALERGKYEAWAVGGCVRDALLGRAAHDWDVCTSATPAQMRACLTDFRLVATGEKHGTLTVLSGGKSVECTTFRADGAYTDHRRPDGVSFVRSLREDLARRDFTINAMACHPRRGLADPFGGQADLAAGLVRCVGEADARFQEDGLRLLRALRFAARFAFAIEPQTGIALRKNKTLLPFIARERVYSELRGILLSGGAAQILCDYPEVIAAAVPELCTQGSEWESALAALSRAPMDFALRLALLCGGEDAPGRAARALDGLRADGETRGDALALAAHRGDAPPQSAPAARRLLYALGETRAKKLLALWRAEGRAGAERAATEVSGALARGDCYALKQLKIDGDALMALGCPAGRRVGETLKALLESVWDGALPNDEKALRTEAKKRLAKFISPASASN